MSDNEKNSDKGKLDSNEELHPMQRFYSVISEIGQDGMALPEDALEEHYNHLQGILSLATIGMMDMVPQNKRKFVEAFSDVLLAFFTFIKQDHLPEEIIAIDLYSEEYEALLKAAKAWKSIQYEKF